MIVNEKNTVLTRKQNWSINEVWYLSDSINTEIASASRESY